MCFQRYTNCTSKTSSRIDIPKLETYQKKTTEEEPERLADIASDIPKSQKDYEG